VFDPHLPAGWEDIRIENLPVGTNVVSFSRARAGRNVEFAIDGREDGWTYVLTGRATAGAECRVNGRRVAVTSSGIRMTGRTNRVQVAPPGAGRPSP